jgi:hypothetical protein
LSDQNEATTVILQFFLLTCGIVLEPTFPFLGSIEREFRSLRKRIAYPFRGSKTPAELNCWEYFFPFNLMCLTPFPFVNGSLHLSKGGKGNIRPEDARIH